VWLRHTVGRVSMSQVTRGRGSWAVGGCRMFNMKAGVRGGLRFYDLIT
jgi:hypothetical protein